MKKMSKFKVGDKVVLKDTSDFKKQQKGIGIIDSLDDCDDFSNQWYKIIWENKDENVYPEEDIIKVEDDFEKLIKMDKARIMAGTILDFVEDLLEEKGVDIPSDDREGRDVNEFEARLFGTEYYILEDKITEYLRKKGVREE